MPFGYVGLSSSGDELLLRERGQGITFHQEMAKELPFPGKIHNSFSKIGKSAFINAYPLENLHVLTAIMHQLMIS
jgi:hypothetical protein